MSRASSQQRSKPDHVLGYARPEISYLKSKRLRWSPGWLKFLVRVHSTIRLAIPRLQQFGLNNS